MSHSSLIRIEAGNYVTSSSSTGNTESQSLHNVDLFGLALDSVLPVYESVQGASLLYDVTIPKAGSYKLFAHVNSTLNNNTLRVSMGEVSETLSFDMTPSWQDIVFDGITLAAGPQQLRLDILSTGFQLNYIDLIPVTTELTIATLPQQSGDAKDNRDQPFLLSVEPVREPRENIPSLVLDGRSTIGEVGQITGLTHERQMITLDQEYVNPVVFVQTLSSNGHQPAIVRLSNIQNNSFELFLQEPSNLNGKHVPEDVSYFVLEAGSWVLDDGTKIEVGTVDSHTLVRRGFEDVAFEQEFSDTPVLFSQVQTFNGSDFVRTRQRATTEISFQVGLEEEEKKQFSRHATESIGWFAIEAGEGDWNGLKYQAGQTGDTITHKWSSIDLADFEVAPNLVTSLASYDGANPAGVRYQNLSANQVEIRVEEDTSADKETRHTTESVSFLALEGNGLLTGFSPTQIPSQKAAILSRDVIKQPFASNSIWNTPIGSNAVFVDANIAPAKHLVTDVDHFFILNGDDPLRPLFKNGSWGPGRGTGYQYQGISLPIPDSLIIEDSTNRHRPNNSAAFLMPDGRTLVQVNALTRDREGGNIYGQRLPFTPGVAVYEDIYGSGILGGHGGSGLSSIGGTIRRGELTSAAPITHALKVNLWGKKYFSYTSGSDGGLGYRWPAVSADGYVSPGTYGGLTPELLSGSLLAIPPDITPESLGIQTDAGKKLFDAFQDYGAYVADDTAWNAHAIAVENGVRNEFRETYGHGFSERGTDFFEDSMQLFSALHVVDNNALDNIGGGGTPRRSLALPLQEPQSAFLGGDGNDQLIGDAQANRIDGKKGHDLLLGHENHDFITGGQGHDSLFGGDGNDNLIGDSGRDSLMGEAGNDYLDGGSYRDVLDGGDGDDYLSGGTGGDKLFGGEGFDTVIESGEKEYVLTNRQLRSTWIDTLESIEHVNLSGDHRNNRIDASAFTVGSTELHGGSGHDYLLGGAGNDQLVSSAGKDVLMGGEGADTFDLVGRSTFLASNRSNPYKAGEYALILDFNPAEDVLKLKGSADQYEVGITVDHPVIGMAIYFDADGDDVYHPSDEVIAIVEGVSQLNLGHAQYQ